MRVLCAIALLTFPAACRRAQTPTTQPAAGPKPITKTAKRGPVEVTVTADRAELPFTERLRLRVQVDAKRQVTVEMPRFGRKLSERPFELRVRDFQETDAVPVDDETLRWTRDFEVEFFISGEYEIPAAKVTFIDERPGRATAPSTQPAAANKHEVATEPFTIKVRSPSDEELDFEQLTQPPVLSTVELPEPPTHWAWYVAPPGAAVVVVASILAIVWWRRRARKMVTIRMTPHEWAYAQLQALIDDDLVEQGRVREFYYRLSDIVRGFIELRYALHAPERTTDEFLAEMADSGALPAEDKAALGPFLEACDMVKFAKYRPAATEIEQTFNAAREFIDHAAPSGAETRNPNVEIRNKSEARISE